MFLTKKEIKKFVQYLRQMEGEFEEKSDLEEEKFYDKTEKWQKSEKGEVAKQKFLSTVFFGRRSFKRFTNFI